MATQPVEKANVSSKSGGVMSVIGILLALVGVGLMATVALTLPGLLLLLGGLGLAAVSYAGAKAATRTPKA